MTINVVVARKRTIRVSANGTAGVIDSSNPVTLKPISSLTTTAAAVRLDALTDVVANNEVDGGTLVYDEATDKYIVKTLDLENTTGTLDGGNF